MTCNLESLTYTVKFYNADYTLLSTQSIPCGQNATAPDTPFLSNLYFDKWSRDFTNVHSNMSVYAVYTMGGNYYYSCDIVRHTNSRYPALGFADNTSRAMMGDTIEFEVSVATPQISNLYFQTGNRKENGEWEWTSPTNNKIGTFDETDIAKNTVKTFTHTFPIAYDYGNEMAWRNAQACRFYISCAGETVYFDPFEFDVYYPLTIQSQIENEDLMFENSDGDFDYSGYNRYFPARYNDTIHIYRMSGSNGTCLQFDRTIHSDRPLTSGLDDEDYAYFICPGEKETINVSTEKYMLVFDDASPTHTFDFSEYGFSYKPNAYYAEVVNCGGRIANMPENPSSESYLFGGWKNNTTDEYADDAYLNIPAIGGSRVLVFSAQWNDKPGVPTYEVSFFEKDSATQIGVTQIVNEGENAIPPQAPEVSGFHFVGWDKDYTTISANTDIYALYGEEGKTWIVSYMDVDAEGAYQLLLRDTVEDGAKAPSVLPPLKENCTFAFWGVSADQPYSNEGEQADLNIVRSDMTVYAKYTKTKQDDEPGDNPGEDPGEEPGDNTALEESADNTKNNLVQKMFINGHLFIRRGNHIYNTVGIPIR